AGENFQARDQVSLESVVRLRTTRSISSTVRPRSIRSRLKSTSCRWQANLRVSLKSVLATPAAEQISTIQTTMLNGAGMFENDWSSVFMAKRSLLTSRVVHLRRDDTTPGLIRRKCPR